MATSEHVEKTGSRKYRGGEPGVRGWPTTRRPRGRFPGPTFLAQLLMMASDALLIVLSFGAAQVLRSALPGAASRGPVFRLFMMSSQVSAIWLAWFILAYLLLANHYGLFSPVPLAGGAREIRLIVQCCLNAGLLLGGGLYMAGELAISRALVVLLFATAAVALSARRLMWRRARFQQFARGVDTRNVVILGLNHLSSALGEHIQRNYRLGYRLRGYIASPDCAGTREVPAKQVLGGADRIRQLTRQYFVDEIVIAEPCPLEQAIRLVEAARELDVDVRTIAGFYEELTADAAVEFLGVFPVVPLHRRDPRTLALAVKRGLDIVLSLTAVVVMAPAMLAVALAIRLEGAGNIIYVSERIGRRGLIFPCFKFRTMVKDAEEMKKGIAALNERDGILFKVTDDPRITRVGKVLRKYSLDELPQFFNVLRGEMSIVGPRPPIATEVEKYELEHFRRLEVLPGLTGLWQVQARQDSSFARYIALDTAYVENWSFWLDLKILLRTAEVVVRGTGT